MCDKRNEGNGRLAREKGKGRNVVIRKPRQRSGCPVSPEMFLGHQVPYRCYPSSRAKNGENQLTADLFLLTEQCSDSLGSINCVGTENRK